jgi:hypothetical protein
MEKSTIYNQTTESQNTVLQTENLKPGSIVCELEGRGTLTITLTPDGKLTGEHQTPNKTFLLSEMEVLNLVNQENIPLQESWPVLEANNNLSKYSDSEIRDRCPQVPLQSADELMLIELHKEIEDARAKLDKITTQITQVKTTGGSPTVLQNPETIIQNQQPVTPESIQYGTMLKMVELLQNKEKQEDLKNKALIIGILLVGIVGIVNSCNKKEDKTTVLAEKIIKAMGKKGYKTNIDKSGIDIVYVTGMNSKGELQKRRPDYFDDARIVIKYYPDGKRKVIGSYSATVMPGKFYYKKGGMDKNSGGAAMTLHKQFKGVWGFGRHGKNQYPALVQTEGRISVMRDENRNGKMDDDLISRGYFGINQHHGYNSMRVGKNGAGCLVGQSIASHEEFLRIIRKHYKKGASISTTIIDGTDFDKK